MGLVLCPLLQTRCCSHTAHRVPRGYRTAAFLSHPLWHAPLSLTNAIFYQDGSVTLKLVINYGVDGGSIVVVGPASCFGSGDINKGIARPQSQARSEPLTAPVAPLPSP
jgi:hypothetical protein